MRRIVSGFVLAVLPMLSAVHAQSPTDEASLRKRWMDLYVEHASQYEIERLGESPRMLEFQPKILFQYTNPEREFGQHGAFFVWTLDGRPEAVGTIWSTIDRNDSTVRNLAHEMHSLSEAPLRSRRPAIIDARGKQVPVWSPPVAGVQWQPLVEAAPPAENRAIRLVQMRQLARGFAAVTIHPKEDQPRELRLLPQPLLRYESPQAEVLDGAIFTFVMGTDPELLLLVEAHESAGGDHWQFAAARFTHIPAELRRGGKLVWQCDSATPLVGDRPYFLYWRMLRYDADLADEATQPAAGRGQPAEGGTGAR